MKLSTILDQIDLGSLALPVFQRGYVWNRDQVRKLMRSLYRGYPVGSLLVWETKAEKASVRGDGPIQSGTIRMLLDGQQRITSLYGIVRGKPPAFFEGDANAFKDLHFNLEDQEFEFYAPLKMKNNPLWISTTELMKHGSTGVGEFIKRLMGVPELQPQIGDYISRLNSVANILDREFHIDNVSGEDKTEAVVVDIFNEVNSGGTKLSQADLALARICAMWPEARGEMRTRLDKWAHAGFKFKLDWLVRCINTTLTSQAYFTLLKDYNRMQVASGLERSEKHIDTSLNLISGRLGLDHDRVLGSRYSFPVLASYLERRGGRLIDHAERDKLLYWYIHTFLWGRYAGSTESTLARDLGVIAENDGALDRLIEGLHQNRGDLQLYPRDFDSANMSSRFYPMLYMLTRVCQAKDWETGNELTAHLLGRLSGLQVHHIFPKAQLRKKGYKQAEINAISNFTFLTQDTNLLVSDRDPAEYLENFSAKNPGVIESHWIPMDRALWHIENYREFLQARRELLAEAANDFLNSLLLGDVPESEQVESVLDRTVVEIPGSTESDEEDQLLQECNGWVLQQGLATGEYQYELVDDQTKEPLAIFDLAWPEGLQTGKSEPVALLLNEGVGIVNLAQSKGYLCFTDAVKFRNYVEEKILGLVSTEAESELA